MKPKYEEVRRMLLLALVCWGDFLNTLNSPLFGKSYLPDDNFLTSIYLEFSHSPEIREALLLLDIYWERTSEKSLSSGIRGLSFSKPHTIFETTLIRSKHRDECVRLVSGVIQPLDLIESPIFFSGSFYPKIDFDLEDKVRMDELVSEYNREMLNLLCIPDPYIRAGVELQLVRRGFQI